MKTMLSRTLAALLVAAAALPVVAISGGASQGLTPGMKLSVKTLGKQVKSGQTGFLVRLPGTEIAKIEVTQNFGDSPETEGSLVKVISGSLGKHDPNKLVIEEIK